MARSRRGVPREIEPASGGGFAEPTSGENAARIT
jgi:hypothetical protein